ncbi:MAG: DUF3419 family protein [Litorilinea sp.]
MNAPPIPPPASPPASNSASSPVSEVGHKADFTQIRYAQCWEDADILLAALAIEPHHHCLSIASAGDNTLSMLSQGPARVVALDLSPAQLACLALRVAAYAQLDHPTLLELLGVRASDQRPQLYAACRPRLDAAARQFWDARPHLIAQGFATVGKFERYLRLFGRWILPLLQTPRTRRGLLAARDLPARIAWYDRHWNHWWWRAVFRIFFSRRVMGRLGRDPSFFAYVEGDVSQRLLTRTRHALTTLDPRENPYLQWILLGHFDTALPHALRPENFAPIRANLDRLEWHCASVETYLQQHPQTRFQRFNLSDIFEYMSLPNYHALLAQLVACGQPQGNLPPGRLVYWNMMAPRRRPVSMRHCLEPQLAHSRTLYAQDKAFFYSDFIIEDIIGPPV